MTGGYTLKTIAHIRTEFPEKFGIPRQSGLVDALRAVIVFEEPYRNPDALRGLEGYSHLWLIWGFSVPERENWSATVRPPRLGGNERVGVFATRSPFRPNPLGLTLVRLEGVERQDGACTLLVSGADMMDGTPIYDIKPYLPYADSRPDASGGFGERMKSYRLRVTAEEALLRPIPPEKRPALLAALEGDPRPAYQHDPTRVYGFLYAGFDVRFTVDGDVLTVVEIRKQP